MNPRIVHRVRECWGKYTSIELLLLLFLIIYTALANGAIGVGPTALFESVILFMLFIFVLRKLHMKKVIISITWIDILLTIFVVLAFVSTVFSLYEYESKRMLIKIISYIALFYLIVNNIQTKKQLAFLVWAIIIFGVLFAIGGLTVFGDHFPGLGEFSNYRYEISFSFKVRNHFAGYLGMIVWLSFGLSLFFKGAKRVLMIFLTLIIAVAIFLSLSRGGFIGFMGGLIFMSICLVRLHRNQRFIWLIFCFSLLIIVVLSILGIEPVIYRIEQISDPLFAKAGRIEYWKGTLNMIAEKPFFGHGLGLFFHVFPRFQTPATGYGIVPFAHNNYLELTSELGLIGLLSILAILGFFFHSSLRNLFSSHDSFLQMTGIAALASCFSLVLHTFFDFQFHIPSNAILFIVCASIAFTCSKLERIPEPSQIHFKIPSLVRIIFIPLVIGISGILLWSAFSPYMASRNHERAKLFLEKKKYDSAFLFAEKAIRLNPENADHWFDAGNVLYSTAFSEKDTIQQKLIRNKSLEHYQHASELCPVKAKFYSKIGFVFSDLNLREQALEAFRKSVYYAPVTSYNHYYLASCYMKLGMQQEAVAEYLSALHLDKRLLQPILRQLHQLGLDYPALELNIPRESTSRIIFSRFLFSIQKTEEGLREMTLAFHLDPTPGNALRLIQTIQKVKGDHEAILMGKTVCSKFKDNTSLQLFVGSLYLKISSDSNALRIFHDLIELNPNDARAHFFLAKYYRSHNDHFKSFDFVKKAVALDPINADYAFELGQEYKRQGLDHLAIEQWRKCLEVNPEH